MDVGSQGFQDANVPDDCLHDKPDLSSNSVLYPAVPSEPCNISCVTHEHDKHNLGQGIASSRVYRQLAMKAVSSSSAQIESAAQGSGASSPARRSKASVLDCCEIDPFDELEAFLDDESISAPVFPEEEDYPGTSPENMHNSNAGSSSGSGAGKHVHEMKVKREGLVFYTSEAGIKPVKKTVHATAPASLTDFSTAPGTLPHTRADKFRQQALASKYVSKMGITNERINSISASMSAISSVSLLGNQGYIDTSSAKSSDLQHCDKDAF